jgi:TPP-dependent pyruvate/acetoin dehydrogenase alpha subunit
MPGEIVDGNDVLAVYAAAGRAVERARSGEGPTLLECKTYRQVGHSRSDPRTYRTREEEQEWAALDPVTRLAGHLVDQGVASEESLAGIEGEVEAEIDAAVDFAQASPDPAAEDALRHVFWDG